MKRIVIISLIILLASCAQNGRYSQRNDSKPKQISKHITFADVTPQYEPYKPANLRPYEVLGKRYTPLKTGKGYSETGQASWYGQKFHGHLTANGEIYDMFSMSAAHKTLPLPSFVRVTNLKNGRQAVVRVNDRGPFHANRIIDLSYAAALKLDIIGQGTAKVKLDIMHVDENGTLTVGNSPILPPKEPHLNQSKALFIQVAALQDKRTVEQLAKGLAQLYQLPTHTPEKDNIYRLRIGPIADKAHAEIILNELQESGYQSAYTLYATP